MSKILGISLGIGTDVFELMRAYGIKADYIPSDRIREIIGFPTIYDEFSSREREALKDGSVREYLGRVQENPAFWDRYVNDSVFLAEPVRDSEEVRSHRSGPVDFESYDAVAVTALDEFYKPLESLLSYLGEKCQKPVVVGGQIVRDATIPFLGKAVLNKGSFQKFGEMLKTGRVIEGGGPLRIESADILEKAGYAAVSNFDMSKDREGTTITDGKPCAHFKVLGMSGCGNGCDYCSSPPSLHVQKSAWLDAISRFSLKERSAVLEIWDDNCFKHPHVYGDIFSHVYGSFDKVRVNTYLDVQDLISVEGSERLLENVVRSPKTKGVALFMGRECADEAGAKVIGRKFNGLVRNQTMLEREKEKIGQVIGMLEAEDYRYATVISYVLGPGESPESIKKDALDLKGGRENVKIQIQPLNAYLGTECYERYKDRLMSAFPGVCISNIDSENMIDFEKNEHRIF